MRVIKLMADYDSFPLWESSPGVVGNINPDELPISAELRSKLSQWSNEFNATLNRDSPADSGFSSVEAKTRFKDFGHRLGEDLKRELGPAYTIIVKV